MSEVLTVEQVAAELDISYEMARVMVARGTIAGVKTSAGKQAHWRIPRASVNAFLGVRARTAVPARALRAEEV